MVGGYLLYATGWQDLLSTIWRELVITLCPQTQASYFEKMHPYSGIFFRATRRSAGLNEVEGGAWSCVRIGKFYQSEANIS